MSRVTMWMLVAEINRFEIKVTGHLSLSTIADKAGKLLLITSLGGRGRNLHTGNLGILCSLSISASSTERVILETVMIRL